MIKDYIIKERLGVGAFGIVYKVLKQTNNNIYVIKQDLCLEYLLNKYQMLS